MQWNSSDENGSLFNRNWKFIRKDQRFWGRNQTFLLRAFFWLLLSELLWFAFQKTWQPRSSATHLWQSTQTLGFSCFSGCSKFVFIQVAGLSYGTYKLISSKVEDKLFNSVASVSGSLLTAILGLTMIKWQSDLFVRRSIIRADYVWVYVKYNKPMKIWIGTASCIQFV